MPHNPINPAVGVENHLKRHQDALSRGDVGEAESIRRLLHKNGVSIRNGLEGIEHSGAMPELGKI